MTQTTTGTRPVDTTVTDTATVRRARALRAAARVVAAYPFPPLEDTLDNVAVECLDAVIALAAHPAWAGAELGTELGRIGRGHGARLIDDVDDDGALWALLHHPDAAPCTVPDHGGIVPPRVPGLTVCKDCAASLSTRGQLKTAIVPPATAGVR